VAGYTLPLAVFEDPGVGEAAEVVIRFAVVGTFGVIGAGHHSGIVIQAHLHILDGDQIRLELGVFDIGQELAALADLAVPFGVGERIGDHAFQCALVAMDLRLVPKMLEHDQLGRLGIVLVTSGLGPSSESKQKATEDGVNPVCLDRVHLDYVLTVWHRRRAYAGKNITVGKAPPMQKDIQKITNVTGWGDTDEVWKLESSFTSLTCYSRLELKTLMQR